MSDDDKKLPDSGSGSRRSIEKEVGDGRREGAKPFGDRSAVPDKDDRLK